MKIGFITPYALVFTVGFALAWLVKPADSKQSAAGSEIAGPGTSRPRLVRAERSTGTSNERTRQLLEKLSNARYDDKKTSALMEEIKTSELPDLVEAITRNAGVTGLEYGDRDKLTKLLLTWSSRDPDAALAWADALQNPTDRRTFLNDIIDGLCKQDPEKALDLTRRYCRKEDGNWDIPYHVAESMVSLEPDAMLETVKSFLSADTASGHEARFPSDYDFRKALDGLAEIEASLKSGERIAVYPNNLIEEWTRRDPSAVWKWLNEAEPFSSENMGDFLEAYCAAADLGSAAQMMVTAAEKFKSPESHYRAVFSILTEKQSTELLQQFLSRMPGDRLTHLTHLFGATRTSFGGQYDRFKDMILSQMNATERITIVETSFKKGCAVNEREIYEPILRRLGHGDGEIQRMLPPKSGGD